MKLRLVFFVMSILKQYNRNYKIVPKIGIKNAEAIKLQK